MAYKFFRESYPNMIQDQNLQEKLRRLPYRNGLETMLIDTFEVFAWYPYLQPGILAVGDRGTIVDMRSMSKLVQSYSKLNGYMEIYASSIGHTLVHLLVARTFVPNPSGRTDLIANHIDAIKTHNWAWNFEWVTVSGNISHAREHGLGTTSAWNYKQVNLYPVETQIKIVKALAEDKTADEIADMIGVDLTDIGFRKRFVGLLSDIRNGRTWGRVVKLLGVKFKPKQIGEETASKILDILRENNRYTSRDVANRLGIEHTPAFAAKVSKIRQGNAYSYLKDPNENLTYRNFDRNQIMKIAEMLDKGYTRLDISRELGVPNDIKLYRTVYCMESGEYYPEITRCYKHFKTYDPRYKKY